VWTAAWSDLSCELSAIGAITHDCPIRRAMTALIGQDATMPRRCVASFVVRRDARYHLSSCPLAAVNVGSIAGEPVDSTRAGRFARNWREFGVARHFEIQNPPERRGISRLLVVVRSNPGTAVFW
jgi:hypothetical protein